MPKSLSFTAAMMVALSAEARADCVAFAITRSGAAIVVEPVSVADGRTEILGGPEMISLVVPVSVGQSADLVRKADGLMLVARCAGDTLKILVQKAGTTREVMARPMAELRGLAIRVGITGGDGARARWRIDGWANAATEAGPVLDLFAGKIPLAPGDYSITTEVAESQAPGTRKPTGEAEVRFEGGYPMVTASAAGRTWRAVVDLAAATSVVAKGALPPGAMVTAATMQEQSVAGQRTIALSGEGAGGAVTGFGVTTIDSVRLGTVTVAGFSPLVLDSLPWLDGRPVDAILGLDLLRPAGTLQMTHIADQRYRLALGQPLGDPRPDLPLRSAGALLGVDARIDGVAVFLILDSGSRFSVVSRGGATAAGFALAPVRGPAPRGLDGAPLAMEEGRARTVALGNHSFANVDLKVADLPVLAKFAASGPAGLLGSDFLLRQRRIAVDFETGLLGLTPKGR